MEDAEIITITVGFGLLLSWYSCFVSAVTEIYLAEITAATITVVIMTLAADLNKTSLKFSGLFFCVNIEK